MQYNRSLLCHFLAALAYRTQKAVRGAPEAFGTFHAADGIRTPAELLRHMSGVLSYARSFFIGGHYRAEPLPSFQDEIIRFHGLISELVQHIEADTSLREGMTAERLLQGPFADAMTHAGQLAMLRRFAGDPVAPENFIFANIDPHQLSPDQPAQPVLTLSGLKRRQAGCLNRTYRGTGYVFRSRNT